MGPCKAARTASTRLPEDPTYAVIIRIPVAPDAECQVAPGGTDGVGQHAGGDTQVHARVEQGRGVADAMPVALQADLQEPDVEVAAPRSQGADRGPCLLPTVVKLTTCR